jgi:hypothetical protein
MTRNEALDKLISARHFCFMKWREFELSDDGGFMAAFRTLNKFYVALRDEKEKVDESADQDTVLLSKLQRRKKG